MKNIFIIIILTFCPLASLFAQDKYEIFRKEILPDPLFRKLYTMFPEKLKMYFHRFFQYYCLETNGIAE